MKMKIFIDKDINQFYNQEAEKRLIDKNDLKYYTDSGVIKVDKNRWLEAQYFENKIWSINQLANDDRNFEHMKNFNDYNFLDGFKIQFPDIIELGCGPFTNIRLILNKIKNNIMDYNLDLLDPLIINYLNHSNCYYKNNKIEDKKINLISSSIEEYDFIKKYDIIIMINVLEHCFNMDIIFNKIKNIMKDDGIFIFGDCCIKNDWINNFGNIIYDSGHPLRVSEKKLDDYLDDYNKIYYKTFEGKYNQPWRIDKYCALKFKK